MMNQILQTISRNQMNAGNAKLGYVTSSNPSNSTIKVNLQPDNTETGWIPYCTPWIGWYAPPVPGSQALVLFQEGSKNVPIGALLMYWNKALPQQGVELGEAILVHSSGSFIQLNNDGSIDINSASEVNITGATIVNIDGTTEVNITSANVNIVTTGDTDITATGNVNVRGAAVNVSGASVILGNGGTTDALVQFNALKAAYDAHTHSGIDPGVGTSGVPTTGLPVVSTTVVRGQ